MLKIFFLLTIFFPKKNFFYPNKMKKTPKSFYKTTINLLRFFKAFSFCCFWALFLLYFVCFYGEFLLTNRYYILRYHILCLVYESDSFQIDILYSDSVCIRYYLNRWESSFFQFISWSVDKRRSRYVSKSKCQNAINGRSITKTGSEMPQKQEVKFK